MSLRLTCPCGEFFEAETEDDLVDTVRKHLAEKHPTHDYTREEILFLSY